MYTCNGNLIVEGRDTNMCSDVTMTWTVPISSADFPECGKLLLIEVYRIALSLFAWKTNA